MKTFTNPIIPGFYPDPSVCRVDGDYYLVTSTFEYFPGVPIFHSKDLINWQQIGHCLTRASQLPLQDTPSGLGGIFAPTLRYHAGTFYMVTTNKVMDCHFFVTADDPAGPWSEPVKVECAGIDPSLFFDDAGKVYFQSTMGHGRGKQGIGQFEIDIETGKALSEQKMIWEGTGGSWPEAPHLYKFDGVYYLMIAEGGTSNGHMITIARAHSPWGPFEGCEHNPILSHRNLYGYHPVQATGHGDLIQAHDGNWWIVFLGIRQHGRVPFYHQLGRETFLAPVTWQDGWPIVNNGDPVELEMPAPAVSICPVEKPPVRDDFNASQLGLCWNFIRNPDPLSWSLTERPGWLVLQGSETTLDTVGSPTFIGRRQQHFEAQVRTLLDFMPVTDGEQAGLTVRMSESHHYDMAVTIRGGERCVVLRRRIGLLVAEEACHPIAHGPVVLGIDVHKESYDFLCGTEETEITRIGTGEARYVSTEICSGFTGVYLGMYAVGDRKHCTNKACFDWFDYLPA